MAGGKEGYATKYYKNIDKVRFNANYLTNNMKIAEDIRQLMADMLIALNNDMQSKNLKTMGMLNFIIGNIVEEFEWQPNWTIQSSLNEADRNRIIHIINHINEHYMEKNLCRILQMKSI